MRAAGELELFVRIVDERAQLALLLLGKGAGENLVHVLAHHARAVVEDVQERLVLTVKVAHEMLGALGQVEDGLQVDDLGEHRLLRGELLGEQAEVLEGLIGATGRVHGDSFLPDGRAHLPSLARAIARS